MHRERHHERIAALQRLADHPSTPAAEAENARRRISEIRAKHPEAEASPVLSDAARLFAEFIRDHIGNQGGVAVEDVFPASFDWLFHGRRGWGREVWTAEPVRPWLVDAWVGWACGRPPGPFGRVGRISTCRDMTRRSTVVSWPCPVCGAEVEHGIDDVMMSYADTEPAARERIQKEVFARLNGNSDNRCRGCAGDAGTRRGEL